MKTKELILAVGILSMLFGCTPPRDRYHSEKAHKKNLANQLTMSPGVVKQLHGLGATPQTRLRLDVFFYTDTEPKGAGLAAALRDLGYTASHEPAANGDGTFVVLGQTTPLKMHGPVVQQWTQAMCELGFAHDAEFDGWGTDPTQATSGE